MQGWCKLLLLNIKYIHLNQLSGSYNVQLHTNTHTQIHIQKHTRSVRCIKIIVSIHNMQDLSDKQGGRSRQAESKDNKDQVKSTHR